MSTLLDPRDGVRDHMRRNGVTPRDHMKENRMLIRNIEAQNRDRRSMGADVDVVGGGDDLYKLAQFRDVPSKVKEMMSSSSSPRKHAGGRPSSEEHAGDMYGRREDSSRRAPPALNLGGAGPSFGRSSSSSSLLKSPRGPRGGERGYEDDEGDEGVDDGGFLHRGIAEQRRMERAEAMRRKRQEDDEKLRHECGVDEAALRSPRKAEVPRERASLAPRRSLDFIRDNKREADHLQPPLKPSRDSLRTVQMAPERHESFGKLPSYLRQRKEEWADEEIARLAAIPDPTIPRGMMVMSQEERLATLSALQENERVTKDALNRMPMMVETPSMRKRVSDLESKLREIEAAIRVFSKERVLVAKDR